MKISFKRSMSILAVSITLFFYGCGGGDTTNPGSNNPGGGDTTNPGSNKDAPIGGTDGKYKYNRISIAGSSVTWGNGMMGNGDYIAPVEEYFRDNIATTIMPNNLSSTTQGQMIIDDMSYKRQLYKYASGSKISGSISGDEISIVFAAQRGAENVVVEMIVDGKSLGEKTIISNPVLHRSKTFSGNGQLLSFDLGEAHTFNHNVDGSNNGFMLKNGTQSIDFGSSDWAIVRKAFHNVYSEVHHFITFKNPPSGSFTVNYDYGENIKPVESSVDNVDRLIGTDRESAYGDLWINNLNSALEPIYGLDFRQNNKKAVKTWKLDSNETVSFTIEVKSGELLLNFVTNHMYFFQNAGIGGTSAGTLSVANGVTGTIAQIRQFDPNLFILESSTNDAGSINENGEESPQSSNKWIIKNLSFAKSSANKITLQDTSLSILSGDVVVMGEYNGDINNIVVGIVRAWDSSNGIITFTTDIPDTSVKICDIKRVTKWEDDVQSVVDKVTANVSHNIDVGIATCGVPNLDKRRLMGYGEKGKMLANKPENNWMFFDFFEKTMGENWSTDNTHANTILGQQLLGEAITDVLFP